MEWNAAIERNREALRRILAALVAMAGLGPHPGVPAGGEPRRPLPRHLHRAVLRLLRPAEAAARRLVIVVAHELAASPQARKDGTATPVVRFFPCLRRHATKKPTPTLLRKPGGTGIFVRPGCVLPPPLTPPHEGQRGVSVAESPSPLWGGVRGGGPGTQPRSSAFQLFDPLRRPFRLRRPVRNSVPRVSAPGFSEPDRSRDRHPPLPGDPLDATRLGLRLAALARALDDLPAQARRFLRWRSRRDAVGTLTKNRDAVGTLTKNRDAAAAKNAARFRRVSPLRGGRPPGSRRRPTHEVHHVLADLHSFAFRALQRPDTS